MNTLIYTAGLGMLCLAMEITNLRKWLIPVILLGLAVIFGINLMSWSAAGPVIFAGLDMSSMLRIDHFSVAFNGVLIVAAGLLFTMSHDFYQHEQHHLSDYLTIIIFILCGAMVLTSFSNLVMMFLGIFFLFRHDV